jgi:uncharacterized protein (DUF952 family)
MKESSRPDEIFGHNRLLPRSIDPNGAMTHTPSATLYKIVCAAEWAGWRAAGRFRGAEVDLADGYIHLSTAAQVEATAAKHFAGRDALVLVALAAAALADSLRYEPARGGELFPHVYGDVPLAAVRWSAPLPLGTDGCHIFPALDP